MFRADMIEKKRLQTVRLWILLAALLLAYSSASAYRKLTVGQTIPRFTLVDVEGTEKLSDSLWKPITIITAVRSIDDMSSRVLSDLADMSARSSSESVEIIVVMLTKPVKKSVLLVPPALREKVLFDTLGQLDSALGFVVYPSTGVFSIQGKLLAYFPLWRKTLKDELMHGINESFSKGNGSDESARWKNTADRGQLLNEAALFHEKGHSDSAVRLLSAGTSSDSTWFEGALALAEIQARVGKISDAAIVLKPWRQKLPEAPELKYTLARVLFAQGFPDSALLILEEGRLASPRPEKFLTLEGDIYYQTNRKDSAVARWREAVELLLGRKDD